MFNSKSHRSRLRAVALLTFCFAWLSSGPLLAQFEFPGGLEQFGRSNTMESEVALQAEVQPATGERPALLVLKVEVAEGFHVYAVDQPALPDGSGPMATEITLSPGTAARIAGPWKAVEAPKSHIDQEIWTGLELREHYDQVVWFAPLEFTSGDAGTATLEGTVEGQACNPETCIPFTENFLAESGSSIALPDSVAQRVELFTESTDPAASRSVAKPAPSAPPTQPYSFETPSGQAYDLEKVRLQAEAEDDSFAYFLLLAFLGGLVLNVMPCVLPVIGLKVMSFVQQAGQSRTQALLLNCWYSAGIVIVFLVLASLAVSLQLGWGGQFGNAGFNVTLIAIVFAMALSLLGVWEIPIPGFVGAGTALELSEREGPTAAFLKGVLTTLLATPCTGPFMATALAWSVKQPAWMTYSVFGVMGLGMASPFLLIGAFPQLVKFLPRPGHWMETFKHIMGLVLMATVVWLLTFIDAPMVVPTVALLMVVGAACWWAAQTPLHAPAMKRLHSWLVAGLVVTIATIVCFDWLYERVMLPRFEKIVARHAEKQIGEQRQHLVDQLAQVERIEQLPVLIEQLSIDTGKEGDPAWQNFSLQKLGNLTLNEGKTVLVDFTADWCLTCKTLEKLVLKTQEVEEALTAAEVVTMEADYTKQPPEIDRTIKALGGVGVPLIAVFPASNPYVPIVFSEGNYTKADIIGAIAKATGKQLPNAPPGTAPVNPTAMISTGSNDSRQ